MCMVNAGKYTSPMDPMGLFIMMSEMMRDSGTLDLLGYGYISGSRKKCTNLVHS